METLNVSLGKRSYPIFIGSALDCGALLRGVMPQQQDVMVVTNETVAPLYLDKTIASLSLSGFKVYTCVLRDGEQYKTAESWIQIHTALLSENLGRDAALIALGGGVIGDMTGFAAATYQRGIAYVQLPTTLLAMVDSSVGGKTAINHPQGKNMIGAFYQPKCVIADIEVLKTLPKREISAGMAEVIKYGIMENAEFFSCLETEVDKVFSFDQNTLTSIVRSCCQSKARIVREDEQEHGRRALLNLGHTFGHAVEAYLGYGTWLHGEAVGLGLVIAAQVAHSRSLLSGEQVERITSLVKRCGLPVLIPQGMQAQDFITQMRHDKKVRQGTIRYVLPTELGQSAVFSDLKDSEVMRVLSSYAAQGQAEICRGTE